MELGKYRFRPACECKLRRVAQSVTCMDASLAWIQRVAKGTVLRTNMPV